MNTTSRIFLLLLIASLVNLAIAGSFALSTGRFVAHARPATGTIIKLEETDQGYCPVFNYTDASGKSYTVESSYRSSRADYAVGKEVRVLYDPQNPADGRLDGLSLWLVPMIFGLIGFGAFGIGLCVRMSGRSAQSRESETRSDSGAVPYLRHVRYARYAAISSLIPCAVLIIADHNASDEAFLGARFFLLLAPVGSLGFLSIALFVIRRIAQIALPSTVFGPNAQEWWIKILKVLVVFIVVMTFLESTAFWLIGVVSISSLFANN